MWGRCHFLGEKDVYFLPFFEKRQTIFKLFEIMKIMGSSYSQKLITKFSGDKHWFSTHSFIIISYEFNTINNVLIVSKSCY